MWARLKIYVICTRDLVNRLYLEVTNENRFFITLDCERWQPKCINNDKLSHINQLNEINNFVQQSENERAKYNVHTNKNNCMEKNSVCILHIYFCCQIIIQSIYIVFNYLSWCSRPFQWCFLFACFIVSYLLHFLCGVSILFIFLFIHFFGCGSFTFLSSSIWIIIITVLMSLCHFQRFGKFAQKRKRDKKQNENCNINIIKRKIYYNGHMGVYFFYIFILKKNSFFLFFFESDSNAQVTSIKEKW